MHRSLWLWGVLVVAGCKDDGGGNSVGPVPEDEAPQTAVNVICDQFVSCDCDPANAAPDGCEVSIDEQVRQAQGDATAAGLAYDADCMGRFLSAFHDIECRRDGDLSFDELIELSRQTDCKVFYGTDQPGEACVTIDELGDSCVNDALCYESLCVAITPPVAEGEECNPALGISACASAAICVDLDDDDRATCVTIPESGDACVSVAGGLVVLCGEGLGCFDGTCLAAPGDGESCHTGGGNACGAGLECNLETQRCQPLPQGGEVCTFACVDGFDCTDGRCVAQEPIICDVDIYDGEPG